MATKSAQGWIRDTRAHIFLRAHETQRKHNQISKAIFNRAFLLSQKRKENNFDLITKNLLCEKIFSSNKIHLWAEVFISRFFMRLQWINMRRGCNGSQMPP